MAWLNKIKSLLPIDIAIKVIKARRTIVRYQKVNVFELKTCVAKGIIRERSWGLAEKIDIFHKKVDGTIQHTPAK
jgi:hypothetical protein